MKKLFMIIDDDEDDRLFFREALIGLLSTSACLEAPNGEDALNQLRQAEKLPDFIFLDVNMHRMNGKECLRELKKDTKLRNIPVIMYSTSFSKESIEEFRTIGSSHYLEKPIDMRTLPEQILLAITRGIK